MAGPATLFDKIWSSHAILVRPHDVTLLHIDRHLPRLGTPEEYAADIDTEETKWGTLVSKLKLKIE